ncbi:hypothetical protein ACHAXH_005570 [Discostella pseudostelligera]
MYCANKLFSERAAAIRTSAELVHAQPQLFPAQVSLPPLLPLVFAYAQPQLFPAQVSLPPLLPLVFVYAQPELVPPRGLFFFDSPAFVKNSLLFKPRSLFVLYLPTLDQNSLLFKPDKPHSFLFFFHSPAFVKNSLLFKPRSIFVLYLPTLDQNSLLFKPDKPHSLLFFFHSRSFVHFLFLTPTLRFTKACLCSIATNLTFLRHKTRSTLFLHLLLSIMQNLFVVQFR